MDNTQGAKKFLEVFKRYTPDDDKRALLNRAVGAKYKYAKVLLPFTTTLSVEGTAVKILSFKKSRPLIV